MMQVVAVPGKTAMAVRKIRGRGIPNCLEIPPPPASPFSKGNPMTDTAKTELVDIDLTVIYLMARYDGASEKEAAQAVSDYLEARGL